MKVLHLTLKRRWFDMIDRGEKLEEYRDVKAYWNARLAAKQFDEVHFANGYRRDSRRMRFAGRSIVVGFGRQDWGAPADRAVYVIELGPRLD